MPRGAAGGFFFRGVLFGPGAGGIAGLGQAFGEQGAEGGEVLDRAEGDELAGEVADGGAFEGETDDGDVAGVGGGLAEEAVFGAAANDEDAVELAAGEALEGGLGVSVAAGEGIADEAGVGGEGGGRGQAAFFQLCVEGGLHGLGVGEGGVGDVEEGGGGRGVLRRR